MEPEEGRSHTIHGPITLLAALFATMLEAHDARYIADHAFVRTIPIPTLGIRTTDFALSRDNSEALYASGRQAAEAFFQHWDFERYKAQYRQSMPLPRRKRVS